jgi:hypothetical protein
MIVQVEKETEPRAPIAYRFDVIRDDFAQIVQIIMTPIEE